MIKKLEFRACISPIMSGIRTGGDGMRVSIDIPESDVIDATALIALRNCPLKITVEVDDSPVATRVRVPEEENASTASPDTQESPKDTRAMKSAKAKGEHGSFWQELFRHGFTNEPSVNDWISSKREPGEADKDVLRRKLGVESLTFAGPDQLIEYLKSVSEVTGLAMGNAIQMVTKAEEKLSK